MATKIIHKKSSVASSVPAAGDLEPGEIAVNLADQKLYSKTTAGAVIELAPNQTAVELLAKIKTVDVNGTAGVNAGTLGGQLPDSTAVSNTIVQRTSSGYIYSNYYNGTGTFATGGNASGMGIFTGTNGNDTFGRSYTAAAARTLLNVEDGATADQTADQLLAAIKTVDVNGTAGVNAGTLDGLGSGSFLRSDANDTMVSQITVSNANPQIKFNDTSSGADDFWVHVNSNNFYVLTDRDESGAHEGPFPMQLEADTNKGYIFGGEVWTSANDGASSGLDADLLDGLHASSFATSAQGTLATNALPKAGGTMTGGINYNDYFETYSADYSVSTTNRKALLWNGATIPNGGTYRFTAHIDSTGTDNSATAVYWNQGGTWKLNVTCQSGTSSNNPEFIIENGVPTLSHDHPANYTVRVYGERMQLKEGTGTDNYNMFGADGFMGSVGNVLRYNPAGSGTTYSTGDVVFHEGNSEAFTSADHTKLDGIETGATADQTFDQLLSKTSGTGEYSTSGHLTSGRGSGGVAMTINDGYGNANLTFNHKQGIPEQLGNGARIVVNTDNTSNPSMIFQMGSATTAGVAYATTERMKLQSTGLTVTGTVTATSYAGDGSSLTGIAAGAGGGGNDEIFWENGQNVTTNYTVTNGKNAMSAGPITINSGVTVTVGAGETWTVI